MGSASCEIKGAWSRGALAVTLTSRKTGQDGEDPAKIVMTYTRPDDLHMTLVGTFEKDAMSIQLRKVDESNLLLLNRGFRWINEAPFNR